ncbi:hypoxia-inducible factor 1-alpha [Plakobranchus ocellatus]|uniref:Hypoxia-inducible factor 1-alpha n=1 Tax=Plakobranchus ocellatus TaxID=259542 RepID=A0AAV4B8Q9_9GAST|nr:hypoxia-inducible factor 1-alpha [Plakobranchus ocellatus]
MSLHGTTPNVDVCPQGDATGKDSSSMEPDSGTAAVETPSNKAKRLRIVAQGRRATENSVLSELTSTLPLDPSVVEKQDKSSMLRLAITYMRLRHALDSGE